MECMKGYLSFTIQNLLENSVQVNKKYIKSKMQKLCTKILPLRGGKGLKIAEFLFLPYIW